MAISRRAFLATAAAPLLAQPKVRTGPLICLYSRLLPDIEYFDMAPVLSGMGFDGCDLSVQQGGTVEPSQISVDLVRAVEVFQGRGVEVPLITTTFVSANDPWARNVIYITGGTGVPFFRPGFWRFPGARLAEMKRQIVELAAIGRFYKMGMGVPNTAGEPVIADLDPNWVGWDFDPSQATPDLPLEKAMPRVKMFILRDARRQTGQLTPCPLGEGIVDWTKFFDTIAHAKFSGPLTLQSDYPAPDRLAAIKKDLDFARQRLNHAYQQVINGSTSPRTSSEPSASSPAPAPPPPPR
ncbi:MAG TPA: sugar phosphate isomerase/epimerase [Bryobacteraceae bacterium]|nr:sugar phosphate isomerase/epimerase [Bryobacteraceae bacterium]